jgi:hypothetical protein
MDKALAYGARDSRFDPWQDRVYHRKSLLDTLVLFCRLLLTSQTLAL